MRRLSRFAPEEIAGIALLLIVLAFAALRPSAITEVFESPYATPAPEGGPARLLVPDPRPTASPASVIIYGAQGDRVTNADLERRIQQPSSR